MYVKEEVSELTKTKMRLKKKKRDNIDYLEIFSGVCATRVSPSHSLSHETRFLLWCLLFSKCHILQAYLLRGTILTLKCQINVMDQKSSMGVRR